MLIYMVVIYIFLNLIFICKFVEIIILNILECNKLVCVVLKLERKLYV